MKADKPRTGWRLISPVLAAGLLLLLSPPATAADNENCFICHSDSELTGESGQSVHVDEKVYNESVHAGFSCVDCHDQPANYDDIPHFSVYRNVDCSSCHSSASSSYLGSFHDLAHRRGDRNAPDCAACHGFQGNPHAIHELTERTAEMACQTCHIHEAKGYDGSVHAVAAQRGMNSPGCTGCHPTHSSAMPPSAGAVNSLCVSCHRNAMKEVRASGHMGEQEVGGVMSCASCHDVHATHRPHIDQGTLQACKNCHPGYEAKFEGSVHEKLIVQKEMNCLSCHSSHQVTDPAEREDFGCGRCHEEAEADYRTSAHRLARLHGDEIAATCGDCHGGHHVLPASDPMSPVNHFNIPGLCGTCHTDTSVITADYVRLPISLPNYEKSIHGKGLAKGKRTAVCTDCHGSHKLQSASFATSMVAKENLARTCGQCHERISREYANSVHGRAVAHGIKDSPSCTDCHDEHLILDTKDPKSPVGRANQASQTCAKCHESPEMAAKYGLPNYAIQSFEDSYHGWAVKRGGQNVAVCEDCHTRHDIRSRRDPESSIHPDNVVKTCARCHPKANPKFAASYTHILARDKMMIHDWVRVVYIWLICIVLGGMALHNAIIMIRELAVNYRRHRAKPAITRMSKNELLQHIVLAVSFTGLAITGFALRFPDAWWVRILLELGMDETVRRLTHRALAVILIAASIWHVIYLVGTKRGRMLLKAIFPKPADFTDMIRNISSYLGKRKETPVFGMFDYTQKAEYWALIWGTVVMGLTGLFLWFPDVITQWLPVWIIRVSETVHFYEAILAVSAIIIWHFFFTIFLPKEYPMSWIWITGRMPVEDWRHHHGREPEETGHIPVELPGDKKDTGPDGE